MWCLIGALDELHKDGVPLVGGDMSDAFLQEVDLMAQNSSGRIFARRISAAEALLEPN
jgi:hypothetical protein